MKNDPAQENKLQAEDFQNTKEELSFNEDELNQPIPKVDLDAPLEIEKNPGEQNLKVPLLDIDAPLQMEGLTEAEDVPKQDLNAPLKIDDDDRRLPDVQGKANRKMFVAGSIISALFVMATAVFLFFFLNGSSEPPANVGLDSQETVLQTRPVLDKKLWTVEVLNGSGVAGAGKLASGKIEALGYKVIKIGNAAKSYSKTSVFFASGFADQADLFMEDIATDFEEATNSGLLEDSTASARIIIGK